MNTLSRNLAIAFLAASTWWTSLAAPKVGEPLVSLKSYNLEGTLPDTSGKVVLVDFWASWCGPCKFSFPALEEIYSSFKDKGLVVLGISLDEDPAEMEKALKKLGVSFPIVRDPKGKLAEKLAIETIPASFLVDRTGKIVAIHKGYSGDKTKKQYIEEIEKQLAVK